MPRNTFTLCRHVGIGCVMFLVGVVIACGVAAIDAALVVVTQAVTR